MNGPLSRILLYSLVLLAPACGLAQMSMPPLDGQPSDKSLTGFAKPYEYERKAYGYDPEGVDYKENQPEDFQVVFITSLPFTALASFGLTSLVSLAARGNFGVNDDYFLPFLAATGLGSTAIACVSVLTNPYPPPTSAMLPSGGSTASLAFNLPVAALQF